MASRGVPWTPVHDYGCGWRECPECGPMIELEIEAKHRKKASNTYPQRDDATRVNEFLGDLYGTAEERGAKVISLAERRAAQGERNRRREEIRVDRTLSADERAEAAALISARPVRHELLREGRSNWTSEVWLELLSPSKLVATRERNTPLGERVRKAIKRAEDRIHRQNQERAKFLPTSDMLRKIIQAIN